MQREEDFLALYRSAIRDLYRWVSRRVAGDVALAEDVTQEVWLRAFAAWRRRGVPADPPAWLVAVAHNLIRDHYGRRRPRRLAAGELDLAREELAPGTPDAAALLHWGLGRLGAGQAALLEAYHLDGKGVAALAAELGLSERAVEGRLRRSREALRRRLAPFFTT